jgi:hypothetical protein
VLTKDNKTFFDIKKYKKLENCDVKTQDEFFISPLCKDFNIKYYYSFPIYSLHTYLGHFILLSENIIKDINLTRFQSFLNNFISKNFSKICLDYQNIFYKIIEYPFIRKTFENKIIKLQNPNSSVFLKELKDLSIIFNDLMTIQLLSPNILKTLYDVHIPYNKNSIEALEILSEFKSEMIEQKSFLYMQMLELTFNNISNYEFVMKKNPLYMTSLDVFEINGHDDIKPKIETINDLIKNAFEMSMKEIFEQCVYIYLGCFKYRDKSVLGIEGYNYRIFLPFYEIEEAIEEIFKMEKVYDLKSLYKIYIQIVEWIHPFEDGNGRCCRLFFTVYLRCIGIPYLMTKFNPNFSFLSK